MSQKTVAMDATPVYKSPRRVPFPTPDNQLGMETSPEDSTLEKPVTWFNFDLVYIILG